MITHYARSVAYTAGNEEYNKAMRSSDAQRAMDDANALATFQAAGGAAG
jgi:hypothetical protein